MTKSDAYQQVTDAILERLEAGVVPWRQPWTNLRGMSAATGKPYRGINVLLLAAAHERGGYGSAYWATYRRLGEMGAQVRKGERGTVVTFWKMLEHADEKTETTRRIPFLRAFRVFNVEQADWAEGMPEHFAPHSSGLDPASELVRAHAVVQGYVRRDDLGQTSGPALEEGGDRAYYRPSEDRVQMPTVGQFTSAHAYYSVMFHELAHSTGHPSRLDREGISEVAPFGSPTYSREELVAEIGSAMIAAAIGIGTDAQLDQSAAYVDGWRKALRDDPKAIVYAAGRAQKAADLVLGETGEEEGA